MSHTEKEKQKTEILVVDDNSRDAGHLRQILEQSGFSAIVCASVSEAASILSQEACSQHVVYAVHSDRIDGLSLLRLRRDLTMVAVINTYDLHLAATAKRLGAKECICKPIDSNAVLTGLRKLLESDSPVESLIKKLNKKLIGSSPAWQGALRQTATAILNLESKDFGVLIIGHSGTGKELIARAIHEYGSRASMPMIPVNASNLSPELLESKLFGHRKGAFTGAAANCDGAFKRAAGGVLFLDEIGAMPLESQPRLLRALQENEYQPLGYSGPPIPFDIKIICATNEPLTTAVEKDKFRKDLFHRINKFVIRTPTLEERGEKDKLELLEYFLDERAHTPEVREAVRRYAFPGNVRQLEFLVKVAIAKSGGGIVGLFDLDVETMSDLEKGDSTTLKGELKSADSLIAAACSELMPDWQDRKYQEIEAMMIDSLQRYYLQIKWEEAGGKISRLAEMTGYSQKRLYDLRRKYGLRPERE